MAIKVWILGLSEYLIASPGDFEAVKLVAQTIKGCSIAGLAR
ncbi:unnamed protein product, partial [marine sediment metagenome]